MLGKRKDNEETLDADFVNSFTNKGCGKEHMEWYLQMPAREPGQIKQWIWDLNSIKHFEYLPKLPM